MSQPASDARFAAGVRLFNHENFFEAHDVWEQVWKNAEGEEKTFYQGLIQAAASASRSTRQFCGRYFLRFGWESSWGGCAPSWRSNLMRYGSF